MRRMRVAHNVLDGKLGERRPRRKLVGARRLGWTIRVNLKVIECEGVEWIQLAQRFEL
jgi:hypothetical protein